MVATNARKLNDAVLAIVTGSTSSSACGPCTTATCCATPESRRVVETPQYLLLRVAARPVAPGGGDELAELISSLEYLPSSPTLFNSGTAHPQMSSCYLLDFARGQPRRHLRPLPMTSPACPPSRRHRAVSTAGSVRGSLIRGTNGLSNGIVPWLGTLDSSVAAVNRAAGAKGAACVYLETWHADIEEFLELRQRRRHRPAHAQPETWPAGSPTCPAESVEKDWQWSLFDPRGPAP